MKSTSSLAPLALLALARLISAAPAAPDAANPSQPSCANPPPGNRTFTLGGLIQPDPFPFFADSNSGVWFQNPFMTPNANNPKAPQQFVWDPTTDTVVLKAAPGEPEQQLYVSSRVSGQWSVAPVGAKLPKGSSTIFKIECYDDPVTKKSAEQLRAYSSPTTPFKVIFECDNPTTRQSEIHSLMEAEVPAWCRGEGGSLDVLVIPV